MSAFDKEATLTQWRGSSEQKGTKHRVSWMKRLKQRIHFRRECDQRCKKEPWSHISNSRSDDKDTVTFLLFRTKKRKRCNVKVDRLPMIEKSNNSLREM